MASIKEQVIQYLLNLGYKWDSFYRGHKYKKLVHDRFVPIFVGHSGAFRRGHTVAESKSITDYLRAQLKLPAYGEAGPCETCKHDSIHQHKLNRGCTRCECKRYSGLAGW